MFNPTRCVYYTTGRVGFWQLVDDQNKLELLLMANTSPGWLTRLRWIGQQLTYLAFHSVRGFFFFI